MIDKNVIASQLSGQQFRISEDMMSAHMETGMTWPQFRENCYTATLGSDNGVSFVRSEGIQDHRRNLFRPHMLDLSLEVDSFLFVLNSVGLFSCFGPRLFSLIIYSACIFYQINLIE